MGMPVATPSLAIKRPFLGEKVKRTPPWIEQEASTLTIRPADISLGRRSRLLSGGHLVQCNLLAREVR